MQTWIQGEILQMAVKAHAQLVGLCLVDTSRLGETLCTRDLSLSHPLVRKTNLKIVLCSSIGNENKRSWSIVVLLCCEKSVSVCSKWRKKYKKVAS